MKFGLGRLYKDQSLGMSSILSFPRGVLGRSSGRKRFQYILWLLENA